MANLRVLDQEMELVLTNKAKAMVLDKDTLLTRDSGAAMEQDHIKAKVKVMFLDKGKVIIQHISEGKLRDMVQAKVTVLVKTTAQVRAMDKGKTTDQVKAMGKDKTMYQAKATGQGNTGSTKTRNHMLQIIPLILKILKAVLVILQVSYLMIIQTFSVRKFYSSRKKTDA